VIDVGNGGGGGGKVVRDEGQGLFNRGHADEGSVEGDFALRFCESTSFRDFNVQFD